jgi:carboxyl-terminal processing protease
MKKIFRMIKGRKIVWIPLILVILSIGIFSYESKDFVLVKNLEIFYNLFGELNLYYVDETDPQKLIEQSIDGMLASLDPYTVFIPESEADDYKFMTTGQYGGVGALIRRSGDYIVISEPYKGFPADKAGLKAGDIIKEINGVPLKGKDVQAVSEMLKGVPNTELMVKVERLGVDSLINRKIIREKITISNVPYYGMLNNSVGYIQMNGFTMDASKEVKDAVIDLKNKQGAKSLILDLRGNPGGLLDEAIKTVGLFVRKGQLVVSTKGKVKQYQSEYYTETWPVDTVIPLVVLVNRGSASASEIVSGALQDLDRAVIIGQKTFGKGLVQTTRPLSYNTQLKVTTAKYYIPSGRCIQALDYTNRNEDGSVGYIPDSLISEFTTKNGRKVYDGGGITPDSTLEFEMYSNITASLFTKNLIFDYATYYVSKHDSIMPANKFVFDDKAYEDFLLFIKGKDFDYTTESSKNLEELIATAKKEKYYDAAKPEFEALKLKLAHDKNKDLTTFKGEIKELIQEEIACRYYYQEGRIASSLLSDDEVTSAVNILMNPRMAQTLLHTSHPRVK